MVYNDFKFTGEDGQDIFTANWSPAKNTKTKAVLQLAHGMAEHIGRYSRFASFLTKHGYIVYGNDHRGAGKTAGVMEDVGFFAENKGFQLVVQDLRQLTGIIRENHPDLPVFLFGHSMGSLLVREYISGSCESVHGAILSGTPKNPGAMGKVGVVLAKMQSAFQGKRTRSRLLNKMTFGSFNARFKPNRTDFDWLTRDNAEVDKYIDDPYCGVIHSAGFFLDLIRGSIELFKPEKQESTPSSLPLLLFSGEFDPVGGAGEIEKVARTYRESGSHDVSVKIYPEGRHEMLNEINKEEVYTDIITWLDDHLSNGHPDIILQNRQETASKPDRSALS